MRMQDLLDEHNVQYHTEGQHHHARRGWLQIDCPFCSPRSGKYRLGFNLSGNYFNCWVCGRHGLYDAVAALTGLSVGRVRPLLAGLTPTRFKDEPPKRGKLVLPGGLQPLGEQHKRYLTKRKLDPDRIVKLWNVQGIGVCPRLGWRIFIPIYYGGEVVSWTTRSISDKVGARYISARAEEEAISLKSLLYGEEYARHTIVINEGPLDVWRIGPGAVATCGVGYTRAQLLRMTKFPVRVVLFDDEPEAQRRADKLVSELAVFEGETYNVVLDGKDAGEATIEDIQKLRRRFLR